MSGRTLQWLGWAAVPFLAVACAPPQVRVATETEATYDGMVPVTGLGTREAWAKPDINLASYDRVLLAPTEFQFRAVREPAGPPGARSTATEFPITPENRERLVATVNDILREEMTRSRHFTLTDTPGPGVLVVETALLDIVSRVPPEPVGRSDLYLDRVGEATLVVELKDAQSGEILARAVDRQTARQVGGLQGPLTPLRADAVTTWAEVRRAARRWARTVVERLDQLHTQGRMQTALGTPAD